MKGALKGFFAAFFVIFLFNISVLANNPIVKVDDKGNRIYGGDPAALVDGDTVYLYLGQDIGTTGYNMPNYLCYSSKDLINWKYEGIPLKASDFPWGSANDSWAAQVIKYKGKYYYYMCKNSTGISVAVSDSPTGPFVNALGSQKLIDPSWTAGKVSWDDIDPTVWVEEDENGVEKRYMMWGNSNLYIVELNEDMISITDKNNDGRINGSDITELFIEGIPSDSKFTEAPWIYKRDGKYYLFFASNWREELSYATADNIYGPYTYQGIVMRVGASSNTNHPAVIDFQGKTYLFYHTGALEQGHGYRRSVCIDELRFDEEGRVIELVESSIGLDGTAVHIANAKNQNEKIYFSHFENSLKDGEYPMGAFVLAGPLTQHKNDFRWEIVEGKYKLNDGKEYVSIQAVHKMGYYITNYNNHVKLLHDDDASTATAQKQTFIKHTYEDGSMAFESVYSPGKYLTIVDGKIELTSFSEENSKFVLIEQVRFSPYVEVTEEGFRVYGAFKPEGKYALFEVRDKDGNVEYIGVIKSSADGEINYTYAPKQQGEYLIRVGNYKFKVIWGEEK